MLIVGEILNELKKQKDSYFDMGVTSPPYNKRGQNGALVKRVEYDDFDDSLKEDEYQNKQIEILNELYRIIKDGGSLFYNNKNKWDNGILIHPYSWLSKTKWIIRQEIIWNRNIAANLRGWRFWNIDERIYWLYKPKDDNLVGEEMESRHSKFSSIWNIRPE